VGPKTEDGKERKIEFQMLLIPQKDSTLEKADIQDKKGFP
jgi:hypothetical protein